MHPAAPPARIALMLPRFSRYGGAESDACLLAEALAARGHTVDFICARREIDPPPGIRVLRTGRPFGPRWLKMLVFALGAEALRRKGGYACAISFGKTLNQDIMRVGGGPLQAFWRLSKEAWAPGPPRMAKQLARRLQPANWLTLALEKRMYTRTRHIIAISGVLREWIEEVYPHLSRPSLQTVRTIYNRPDTSRFSVPSPQERAEARRRLVPDANAYVVGIATTNFVLKGVGRLIEALALLPEDTHLCVAGGRDPKQYQALAQRLGLASRTHFCGKVKDMRSFYHGLDLFILPTFYDTLGNVVLEALACGLKTICSDRAGAAAFLPEQRILRHPESPEAIAAVIQAARSDTARYPAIAPRPMGLEELVNVVEEFLAAKG